MSLFSELQRRNVFRVAAAYVVVAWLLIQVAETLFPLFGFGDSPARLVVIVLAIAFLPVLVFAWAFELTPDGLKKEKDVDRSQSIRPQTGRKLDRMIMVVLALALGYFAFDKFVLDPLREAASEVQKAEEVAEARQQGRTDALVESYGEKSIAVLAFQDMSRDKDQEYLSDGIAEELLNLLAKIPEMRVISRTSAFSYKGKNIKLAQVAEELDVAHILEGSVRKSGNKIRITAQLIEARSDTHLWSETYDRNLDNIFAIQDEIAAAVVKQLKVILLDTNIEEQKANPEAYTLLLQARHFSRQNSVDSYEKAIALYEQALALDPGYAAAWLGLATIYTNQAGWGLRPFDEGFNLAREAANKALSIDPNYAPAHAALGAIAQYYEGDLSTSARQFERALALDPGNLSIIARAAGLLSTLGRSEQAITMMEYVTVRDPVNPAAHASLGFEYYTAKRWDEAIATQRTVLMLNANSDSSYFLIGNALLWKGEAESALEAMRQEPSEAWRMLGLVMAHHALSEAEVSNTLLAELIDEYGQEWSYNIAYVLAYRNEPDHAFEWLEKAVAYGDPGLAEIVAEPLFSNIHADPRWLPFLARQGKTPMQLEEIKFEVKLPQ